MRVLRVLFSSLQDGLHPTVVAVAAYLLFLGALPSPSSALQLFSARRVGAKIDISSSEKR